MTKILDSVPILYLNSYEKLAILVGNSFRSKFNTTNKMQFIPKMVKEFRRSESYHLRIFYAKFALVILQASSKMLIRSYVLQDVLSLSKDKVVNVRLACIPCLFELRKLFSWNDEELLMVVRETLCRLQVDKDKQVKEVIQLD